MSRQLPPELLSAVFEFAVWSDPYVPAQISRSSSAVQGPTHSHSDASSARFAKYDPNMRSDIGLVSKGWKHIRDSTPHLWTRLDIVCDTSPHGDYALLSWLVARSGCLPLDVMLSCSSSERSSSDFAEFSSTMSAATHAHVMQSVTKVLTIIQHSIPRWRTLSFTARTRAEVYAALLQFRQPAQMLESLTISTPALGHTVSALSPPARADEEENGDAAHHSLLVTSKRTAMMPPLFVGRTPALQNVRLRPYGEPIDGPLLHHLRVINLIDGWGTVPGLFDVMEHNADTLEELSIVTVDLRDFLWTQEQYNSLFHPNTNLPSEPTPFIEPHRRPFPLKLSHLNRVRLDAPRSVQAYLFSRLSLPSLSSLSLRRTEEPYEDWTGMVNITDLPEAEITPSTAQILSLLEQRSAAGHLGSVDAIGDGGLKMFSLNYGSVWELNAAYREQETDDAIRKFLHSVGGGLETLEVQNYSHCESTLLNALSRYDEALCPCLRTLDLVQCEGADRNAILRLIVLRTNPQSPPALFSSTSPPRIQPSLRYLSVEARSGRIICSTEDERWAQDRLASVGGYFNLEQMGFPHAAKWIDMNLRNAVFIHGSDEEDGMFDLGSESDSGSEDVDETPRQNVQLEEEAEEAGLDWFSEDFHSFD